MTTRNPLVLIGNDVKELPAGDTVTGGISTGTMFPFPLNITSIPTGYTELQRTRYEMDTTAHAALAAVMTAENGGAWSSTLTGFTEPPGTGANNGFGQAVAISGDGLTMAIAAPFHTGAASQCGAVYIYTRSGSTWTYSGTVFSGPATANANLGNSLAFNYAGTVLAIGCPGGPNASATLTGNFYVATLFNGAWTLNGPFYPNNLAASQKFGTSIDISSSGDIVLVGGPATSGTTGFAQAFYRSKVNVWTYFAQLDNNPTQGTTDLYGYSVALSGDGSIALVSGPNQNTSTGMVAVFHLDTTTASYALIGTFSGTNTGDHFGWCVDISRDGRIIAVGAYSHQVGANANQGIAYTYDLDMSGGGLKSLLPNYTNKQSITASDGAAGDKFGIQVALSGDGYTLVVGAPTHVGTTLGGSVYCFKRQSNDTWSQHIRVDDPDNVSGYGFGNLGVSLSDDSGQVAVGAAQSTVSAVSGAGKAFVGQPATAKFMPQRPDYAKRWAVYG